MADIQFEEERQQYRQPDLMEDKPWSVRTLMKTGVIASETHAKYVLLGVAVAFTLIAIAIPFFSGSSSYRVPDNIVNRALQLPDVPVGPTTGPQR